MAWLSRMTFPDLPRAALRSQLLDIAAVPHQHVDEVADLACHAAQSGMRTMLEVVDRASDPRVMLAALGPAAALLRSQVEVLEASLKSLDGVAGLKVSVAGIEGGSNGG